MRTIYVKFDFSALEQDEELQRLIVRYSQAKMELLSYLNFQGGWMSQEEAIIKLRSAFIQNEGTEYLLGLLSRISKEEGVSSADNGVSQAVTTRQGIMLKNNEQVRPRIALQPYRTFTEVEQPVSEFILRLDDSGRIGLISADGDAWKMTAKARIASYFVSMLAEEVEAGTVVVMI